MKELTKEQWFEVACIVDKGFIGSDLYFKCDITPDDGVYLSAPDKDGRFTPVVWIVFGFDELSVKSCDSGYAYSYVDKDTYLRVADYINSIKREAMPPAPPERPGTMKVDKVILIDMYLALCDAQENVVKIIGGMESHRNKEQRCVHEMYQKEFARLGDLIEYCKENDIAPF